MLKKALPLCVGVGLALGCGRTPDARVAAGRPESGAARHKETVPAASRVALRRQGRKASRDESGTGPEAEGFVGTTRVVEKAWTFAPEEMLGFRVKLHPGARVRVLRVAGERAEVRVTDYRLADEDRGEPSAEDEGGSPGLVGSLPLEALGPVAQDFVKLDDPPGCSSLRGYSTEGRVARNVDRRLVASSGAGGTAVETNGGDIEIIEEQVLDGARFQRVRQITHGVELFGWTAERIRYALGGRSCMADTVYFPFPGHQQPKRVEDLRLYSQGMPYLHAVARPGVALDLSTTPRETWARALELFESPEVEAPLQLVDPAQVRIAVAAFRREKVLYGLQFVDDTPVCGTHQLRQGAIEIVSEGLTSEGRVKYVRSHGLSIDELGEIWLEGTYHQRTVNGVSGKRWGLMCASATRLLGQDSEGYFLGGGSWPVLAFHPDDVTKLYRDRRVCEEARERASAPLTSEREELASSGVSVRPMEGC